MKRAFFVHVFSVLLVLMAYQSAESLDYFMKGQITVNNHTLHIKGSAAYWDNPNRLLIFFYPFALGEEAAQRLESGFMADFTALANRPSPDPTKWDYCPYGMLEVSFTASGQEKSLETVDGIILALFGFKPSYMTININRYGKEARDFLGFFETGRDKSHGYVRLSAEGDDTPINDVCSWKLSTFTQIFPAMGQ
jgi:hypothetical protein